jgi:antirestriction protein ArdC
MYRSSNRKPRRQRTRYDGRTYAAGRPERKPERQGPSKRHEAAEAALAAVLELFESGELAERIAETVIARAEGESPAANWSLGNQLLMLLAGTTDARGYRQWQEVGRHVRKGARAFYILAPIKRKIRERDDETGEEGERVIVAGFTGVPVFRYEDTEGLSIEPTDYRPATVPPLYDVAAALGVDVSYAPCPGRFRGYYSPGEDRIVLCSHDVRTFFHELAHAAHYRARPELAPTGGQDPFKEVVAETVAATLCQLYGFAGYLGHSADYIEHYGGENPGRAAMKVLADVQAVLALILEEAGSPASSSDREAVPA